VLEGLVEIVGPLGLHQLVHDPADGLDAVEDEVHEDLPEEVGRQQFDPEAVYGRSLAILEQIFEVIRDRKANPQADSYVSGLFAKGQDLILKKVVEEATESVVASKNGKPGEIIYEVADLWFHTLVLLGYHGITPQEVAQELRKRYGKKGKAEYR